MENDKPVKFDRSPALFHVTERSFISCSPSFLTLPLTRSTPRAIPECPRELGISKLYSWLQISQQPPGVTPETMFGVSPPSRLFKFTYLSKHTCLSLYTWYHTITSQTFTDGYSSHIQSPCLQVTSWALLIRRCLSSWQLEPLICTSRNPKDWVVYYSIQTLIFKHFFCWSIVDIQMWH